jgi:hypothetical protein
MGESFGNTLKGFVEDVNMAHGEADKTVEGGIVKSCG